MFTANKYHEKQSDNPKFLKSESKRAAIENTAFTKWNNKIKAPIGGSEVQFDKKGTERGIYRRSPREMYAAYQNITKSLW